MAVWEAEREHGLVRADLLPAAEPCSANGESAAPAPVHFYCRVCLVTFSSQESFESHCSSVEHVQMLSVDTSIQWAHRAPPLGLSKFSLCSRAEVCEMGSSCTKAHSAEELQEWIQREKVATKKKKQALKEGLLSYQDRLIAEYRTCSNEVLIMAEHVEGVRVVCEQPLTVQSEDRRLKYCWKFRVHSQVSPALRATGSARCCAQFLSFGWAGGRPLTTSPAAGRTAAPSTSSCRGPVKMWICWPSTNLLLWRWTTSARVVQPFPSPVSTIVRGCMASSSVRKKPNRL
uniref:C2H2-type domain-containing protein n=1 Tax=Strix occidentalis caurina TaxID=311401 RepID=A0A8D0FID5_STROC